MVRRRQLNREQLPRPNWTAFLSRRSLRLVCLCGVLSFLLIAWIVIQRQTSGGPASRPDTVVGNSAPLRLDPSIQLPTEPARWSVQELREEVEAVATELVRRYPDSSLALHTVARLYLELQQYSKAADIWQRCAVLAPNDAGPRVGLALVAMARGEDRQAVKILQEALAAGHRTSELFQELATALQKASNLDEAERVLQLGLESYPGEPLLWTLLGQIQLQQDKLDDSEASLREAIRLQPDSTPAQFAMATVAARLGKPEAATHRQQFNVLKSKHPLAENRFQVVYEAVFCNIVVNTLCEAAGEYQRQNEPLEAERLYLRALELVPFNADTCRPLASFYHAAGKIGDAQLVQRRLVDIEPARVENYINLASLCARRGETEDAESVLFKAQQIAPKSAIIYYSLARLNVHRGQFREARLCAEKAAQLEPSAEHYFLLAAACQQLGDAVAADVAMRSARELAAGEPANKTLAP